eukprot:TRINITY_DN990_c0_g1_i1.p1 TRINITY_DN990_c0_g1~~TRINITY_DN990_c0_g1_i1.p1  ORF type:complete len:322 (+),score=53.15 TRINITY_DN990_c0_g1_i1:205-1170(+)
MNTKAILFSTVFCLFGFSLVYSQSNPVSLYGIGTAWSGSASFYTVAINAETNTWDYQVQNARFGGTITYTSGISAFDQNNKILYFALDGGFGGLLFSSSVSSPQTSSNGVISSLNCPNIISLAWSDIGSIFVTCLNADSSLTLLDFQVDPQGFDLEIFNYTANGIGNYGSAQLATDDTNVYAVFSYSNAAKLVVTPINSPTLSTIHSISCSGADLTYVKFNSKTFELVAIGTPDNSRSTAVFQISPTNGQCKKISTTGIPLIFNEYAVTFNPLGQTFYFVSYNNAGGVISTYDLTTNVFNSSDSTDTAYGPIISLEVVLND